MVLAPIVALGGALRWSRWPRFALGAGTVAFFVELTGAEPSVMRAGVMAGLALRNAPQPISLEGGQGQGRSVMLQRADYASLRVGGNGR